MSSLPASLPAWKRILFFAIMCLIPVAVPVAGVMGYYAYKKMTWAAVSCGSFGQVDDQLGWVLKPGADACAGARNPSTGEVFFMSRVAVNADGFRDREPNGRAEPGRVVVSGDSWSFGWGVDYDQSYPGQLERLLGEPVVNLGIPAYGQAQAMRLLERHVEQLRPRAVVVLTRGMWQRSLCHGGTRPEVDKPCFWLNPDSKLIELVDPPPGKVTANARFGIYPGGYLTAGNDTWSYFLLSRPLVKARQLLTQLGLRAGHASEYDNDPRLANLAADFTVRWYVDLARRAGTRVILIDPFDDYRAAEETLAPGDKALFLRVDARQFGEEVDKPASGLPPAERQVPMDGHYGPGANRLIAELIARRLQE